MYFHFGLDFELQKCTENDKHEIQQFFDKHNRKPLGKLVPFT